MTARRFIPLSVVAAVTLITFWGVIANPFVSYDDPAWIAQNPRLLSPSFFNVLYFWTHSFEGLYVPLTFSYWSALAALKMSPAIFHAGSVLLHVLSAVVVYAILRDIDVQELPACMGAMVFAVHPLQVESVAWASGAKDALAGLLSLIAIWQFLLYANVRVKSSRRALHWTLSILALIGGMLAKPSAVVAPLMAGTLDVAFVRKDWRATARSIWPVLLLAIPFVVTTRQIQTAWSSTVTPLWMRPLIAADAIAFYLCKLAWPESLTIFYGRTPQAVIESGAVYFTWMLPAVIVLLLILNRRRLTEFGAPAIVFVIGLLPVLGLSPFMFQLYSTVADHYVYLAMLGVSLVAAIALAARPTRLTYALCGIVILFLATRSSLQVRYWHDSVTLMSHAVDVTPDNADAQGHLGLALAQAGRVSEAIERFQEVVQMRPNNPDARAFLGLALSQTGRFDEAEKQLRIGLSLRPNDPAMAAQLAAVHRQLDSSTTKQ